MVNYEGKPHADKLCLPQACAWMTLHVDHAFVTEADGVVEAHFS